MNDKTPSFTLKPTQALTPAAPVAKVYQAIGNVTAALSRAGISKDRKNQQQGYQFRGIDDIYAALSPLLSEHKLCMLPRVLTRTCEERATQKGSILFYVNLMVEFDLVSSEDGSKHTICVVGEAMDSGDKATNKAQSAAYKYAAMMAFCIPTEGSGKDTEEETHDGVQPRGGKPATPPAAKSAPPKQETPAPVDNVPVKPPHDPKTGEILPPHAIAVPMTNGVGDPDLWAKIYIAALMASPEKVEEWVKLNANLMGQLANYSKNAHKQVTEVLDKIRSPAPEATSPIAAG